jgi:hypothetical protein
MRTLGEHESKQFMADEYFKNKFLDRDPAI